MSSAVSKYKVSEPIAPGELLANHFIAAHPGLTAHRVAIDAGLRPSVVREIIQGKRKITTATALRLARYFGTTPQFWTNLQAQYELDLNERRSISQMQRVLKSLPSTKENRSRTGRIPTQLQNFESAENHVARSQNVDTPNPPKRRRKAKPQGGVRKDSAQTAERSRAQLTKEQATVGELKFIKRLASVLPQLEKNVRSIDRNLIDIRKLQSRKKHLVEKDGP